MSETNVINLAEKRNSLWGQNKLEEYRRRGYIIKPILTDAERVLKQTGDKFKTKKLALSQIRPS